MGRYSSRSCSRSCCFEPARCKSFFQKAKSLGGVLYKSPGSSACHFRLALIDVSIPTVASEFRKRGSNHEGPSTFVTLRDKCTTAHGVPDGTSLSTAALLLLAHHFFLQLAARLLGIADKLLSTLHAILTAFLYRSFHQFLLMLLTGVIKLCPVRLFHAGPWAVMVLRFIVDTSTQRFETYGLSRRPARECFLNGCYSKMRKSALSWL